MSGMDVPACLSALSAHKIETANLLASPSGVRVVNGIFGDDIEDPVVLVRRGFEGTFPEGHVVEQVFRLIVISISHIFKGLQ